MKQLFVIAFVLLVACNKSKLSKYDVGDIPFDKNIDDINFKICDEKYVLQYYNREKSDQYTGEKRAISDHFLEKYAHRFDENQNGYLTIRFIVNCKGKTGRFRVQELGFDYSERKFDTIIKNQLLTLTKQLIGWKPIKIEGSDYDYYRYLTFKIVNGQLMEILP